MTMVIFAARAIKGVRSPGIVFTPRSERGQKAKPGQPGTDDHQRQTQVEQEAGLQRRVEGVENGRQIGEDWDSRQDQPNHHQKEAQPVQARVT